MVMMKHNYIKALLAIGGCLLAVGLYFQFHTTLGIGIGAIWGSLNLYFIKQLVKGLLIAVPKKYFKSFLIALIKFPLLYTLGYGLLLIDQLSPWSMLVGFSLVLAIHVQSWRWETRHLTRNMPTN